MRTFRSFVAASLLVLITAPQALCQDTITIGAILSLSGPASTLGTSEKNSILLLSQLINDRGGVLGKQIHIVIYDDESDISMASYVAGRLVNHSEVSAVIGPSTSGNTIYLANTFTRAGIPLISLAQGDAIVEPVRRWIFKTAPSIKYAVIRSLKYAREMGIQTAALLTELNAVGQEGRDAVKTFASDYQIEIVADEDFISHEWDMTAHLTRISDIEPDALICWGSPQGLATLLKKKKELEIDSPFFLGQAAASRAFIRSTRGSREWVYFPSVRLQVRGRAGRDPQGKAIEDFSTHYRERYNEEPDAQAGYAWDALSLIVSAIEEGWSSDPSSIRDNLEGISGHVGVTGVFNLSPRDHNGLDENTFVITEFQEGKLKIAQ